MRLHSSNLLALALAAAIFSMAGRADAADWITAPSTYTHDPNTAERVAQYSPIGPFYYYQRPDYMKSGYRHLRSTIDLGNSSDNLHIVEQWGLPVRPYDEWRFPYRPFSVPYDAWGPPYGGLGGGNGLYPYSGGGGFGGGFGPFFPGGGGGPGGPGGNQPAVNFAQPWLDGHYPQYDLNDRTPYWKPYVAPMPGP
jgi:hypothetical protein